MATTTLKSWGNSLAIRIPKSVLKVLNLQEGDEIEFKIKKDKIELLLSHELTLESLLAQLNSDNKQPEFNWGKRKGKEEW